MKNDTRLAEINRELEAAWDMVYALCKRRNQPGSREWIMTIPVDPSDPDVVIGNALKGTKELLAEITRLKAREAELVEGLRSSLEDFEFINRQIESSGWYGHPFNMIVKEINGLLSPTTTQDASLVICDHVDKCDLLDCTTRLPHYRNDACKIKCRLFRESKCVPITTQNGDTDEQ